MRQPFEIDVRGACGLAGEACGLQYDAKREGGLLGSDWRSPGP